ncbi:hypothetical protein RIF29_28974 [Crotalaria pallida]|uniref:Secreted protein n=1 Tax=Crotalaria pallida TaxID=3830 RepID=A0AAN9EDY2_CROPI
MLRLSCTAGLSLFFIVTSRCLNLSPLVTHNKTDIFSFFLPNPFCTYYSFLPIKPTPLPLSGLSQFLFKPPTFSSFSDTPFSLFYSGRFHLG